MNDAELKLRLLFCPVSMGTLWRVSEITWKNSLNMAYDQESTRPEHPGLSVLALPPRHSKAKVPLLHGRTEKAPVKISDTSPDKRCTHFGHLLKPARLEVSQLHRKINEIGVIGSDLEENSMRKNKINWTKKFDVIPNTHKPKINNDEKKSLDKFLISVSKK